mgnify:CR=1 FL=1
MLVGALILFSSRPWFRNDDQESYTMRASKGLKEEGNTLYRGKRYGEAAAKYEKVSVAHAS